MTKQTAEQQVDATVVRDTTGEFLTVTAYRRSLAEREAQAARDENQVEFVFTHAHPQTGRTEQTRVRLPTIPAFLGRRPVRLLACMVEPHALDYILNLQRKDDRTPVVIFTRRDSGKPWNRQVVPIGLLHINSEPPPLAPVPLTDEEPET